MSNRADIMERDIERILAGVSPAEIRKALRSAMRSEANKIARGIRKALAKSMPSALSSKLAEAVGVNNRRDGSRFRVYVKGGRQGGITTSRGVRLPLAYWWEHGFRSRQGIHAIDAANQDLAAVEASIERKLQNKVDKLIATI